MHLLSMKSLRERKGIPYHPSHIYRLINEAEGDFPKPVRLGKNKIAFVEEEIDNWLKKKIAERDGSTLEAV